MTTAADSAAERAFEAALSGRPLPPGTEGLGAVAAFTGAVRATATQPGRPNAVLAELLANGLIVDQPSPSARTAKRRRRRMWFFTAIIAKIASAGAVAQAATGAAIVLVGFTGAGAAGALPDPVQHTFATVVDHVTPLTAPDPGQSDGTTTTTATTSSDATETSSSTAATSTSSDASESADPSESEHPDNFGKRVSSAAHESGGVDGHDVSSWAHERNQERHDHGGTASASASATPTPTTSRDGEDGDHQWSGGQQGSGSQGGHGDR